MNCVRATAALLCLFSVGCAKDGGGEGSNTPPTASAGAEQAVDALATVTLDATASYDAESASLEYAWVQVDGVPVALSGEDSARPTFIAPDVTAPSQFVFAVTVRDPQGLTATDSVTVSVAPVAVALGLQVGTVRRNTPFDALVTLRNGSGAAITGGALAESPIDVTLRLGSGAGVLSGTLSGTLTGGAASFTGLRYDLVEAGVVLRAESAVPALTGDASVDVVWQSAFPGMIWPPEAGVVVRSIAQVGTSLVVGGAFNGTAVTFSFDGSDPALSSTGDDGFVAAYSPTGALRWARQFSSAGNDSVVAVAAGSSGETFVVLNVRGDVSLPVAPGAPAATVRNTGGQDVVIVRLDAAGFATGGTSFEGLGDETAYSLLMDGSNPVIAGTMSGDVDFDPNDPVNAVHLSYGPQSAFVVRLRAASMGTTEPLLDASYFPNTQGTSMAAGVAKVGTNLAVVGWYAGTVDFGGGPLYSGGATRDACHLTLLGSGLNWLGTVSGLVSGNMQSCHALSAGLLSSGVLAVTGEFNASVAFGGGASVTTRGGRDAFVATFSMSPVALTTLSAIGFGSAGDDSLIPALTQGPSLWLGGTASGTVDVDGDGTDDVLVPTGTAAYLVRLSDSGGGLLALEHANSWQPAGANAGLDAIGLLPTATSYGVMAAGRATATPLDLDPRATSVPWTGAPGEFLVKLDPDGVVIE